MTEKNMDKTKTRPWWEYQREGFEYEEWDELAQDEYRAYCELKCEERWEREHGVVN